MHQSQRAGAIDCQDVKSSVTSAWFWGLRWVGMVPYTDFGEERGRLRHWARARVDDLLEEDDRPREQGDR